MDKNNSVSNIYSLRFRAFVAAFRAESAALWFLCFYIFIEYIRPQGMYHSLDVLPWGQVAILSCFASALLTKSKPKGIGAMDAMFIIFSFLLILSVIFAWSPGASLQYWTTYTTWILMYFCIVSILTSPNKIFLFTLFFILINLKMSEHGARSFALRGFSFAHWGLAGAPGWFHNSGELGLQMVVMFSMSLGILLALRDHLKDINSHNRWLVLLFIFSGTSLITVIGSSSRGAQIALAAVLIVLLFRGKYLFRKALIIGMVAFLGLHILPEEQIERFMTMGDDQTSQYRLTHWENAIDVFEKNPLGIGYRNWPSYYAANYDPVIVQEIHNTVLEAFVELGYPGGILFILMVLGAFVMNFHTIREMNRIGDLEGKALAGLANGINLALLGAFIAALFMSVLYYPIFWLAFALTSALRHISKNKTTNENKSINSGDQRVSSFYSQ